MKKAVDDGEEMPSPPGEGYDYLGGKPDDVTVTVAQIFVDLGQNDPMR